MGTSNYVAVDAHGLEREGVLKADSDSDAIALAARPTKRRNN